MEEITFNYQVVTVNRSRRRRRNGRVPAKDPDFVSSVEEKRKILSESTFYGALRDAARTHLMPPKRPKIVDIVCYGIGSVKRTQSQYQFALALLLRDLFEITGSMHAYDPVWTEVDKKLLNHYDVLLIQSNEKGKRAVTQNTLFYMPHCALALYNNVIGANWSRAGLEKVVIAGNRFDFYNETLTTSELRAKAPYISSALSLWQSVPFPDAAPTIPWGSFNDLCCQWFAVDGTSVERYDDDVEFWSPKECEVEDDESLDPEQCDML